MRTAAIAIPGTTRIKIIERVMPNAHALPYAQSNNAMNPKSMCNCMWQ